MITDIVADPRRYPAREFLSPRRRPANPGTGDIDLIHLHHVGGTLPEDFCAELREDGIAKVGAEARPVDRNNPGELKEPLPAVPGAQLPHRISAHHQDCLLYTSDAADE